MRIIFFVICVLLLHLNFVSCFSPDNVIRVKRSNETEGLTLKKVKDSVKSFGSKVSGVASKGYEEFKNLFSRERKVGDYQLNNIDVRAQREEDDYEEVAVKKRPKRDDKSQKSDEKRIGFVVNLDEIMKDINVLETTDSK